MTTPINIAELDYDQILANLVEFMRADPTFADYDFSGSGLQLLSRVLAYVTFYQNHYLSVVANESFLDTAQMRSSVASHARMLGYNIKGTQSARIDANVAIELSNTDALSITLPALTQFTLSANSGFTFYNLSDVELSQNTDSLFYEGTVELVEGRPLQHRFTVDLTNPTQRFIIPNGNIDYTTISVTVNDVPFTPATDMMLIEADDAVFFVQESYDQFPELKFGNGVVGRALTHGQTITATYLVSQGDAGNNLRGPFRALTANVAGFLRGATTADANTVPSMGGTAAEDLDAVRFIAPLAYQTQNRCVTADDYKAVILERFGEHVAAINVFGGEEGDPRDPLNRPSYGRVFVAMKPKIGLRFTDVTRTNIEQNILKPRSIVGVIPEVIDPDYTYLNVTTSVKYDPRSTTRSKTALQASITESVLDFAERNIEKFDTAFRFSKFVRVIDDSDESIVSSLTRIDLEKRIYPEVTASNQFILKFNTSLRRNSVGSSILESTSHRFSYVNNAGETKDNCFLFEQDGDLHVAYRDADGQIAIHHSNIGSVDVSTGLITIANFAPTGIENGEIDVRIRVIPTVNDFVPQLNQLFTIDRVSGVSVQVLNDNTATVDDQMAFFAGGVLP